MQAIVSLYQALGGGWLPKPVEAAMHGEFSKQILAKARSGTRRTLVIGIVLIALAAVFYYIFSASAPQQRRGGRFAAGEGPVPVLVAPRPVRMCRSIWMRLEPSKLSTR